MLTRQLTRAMQEIFCQARKLAKVVTKGFITWLLRGLFALGRRTAAAGFVLPTVVMVTLVVVLLTTAVMLRSFDRTRNASNFRVNEVLLNAAAPALDRARLKLSALFADPALPTGTPAEESLYNLLLRDRYRFGDETRLTVASEFNGASGIQADEQITTAWRFAADTDNNGKFDSYTLYGIYLKSPSVSNTGEFNRPRSAIEARTPPMVDQRQLSGACAANTGTAGTSYT
ncbi:MAG: hypothetical protein SFW36_23615, partial [Leptolyngbyaceae cyanobacterium bins.59]|nr:hypothetical protein [Leptolyngbyaceae cyanobacterium bins.59]